MPPSPIDISEERRQQLRLNEIQRLVHVPPSSHKRHVKATLGCPPLRVPVPLTPPAARQHRDRRQTPPPVLPHPEQASVVAQIHLPKRLTLQAATLRLLEEGNLYSKHKDEPQPPQPPQPPALQLQRQPVTKAGQRSSFGRDGSASQFTAATKLSTSSSKESKSSDPRRPSPRPESPLTYAEREYSSSTRWAVQREVPSSSTSTTSSTFHDFAVPAVPRPKTWVNQVYGDAYQTFGSPKIPTYPSRMSRIDTDPK